MSDLQFGICGDLDQNNTPPKDDPLITLKKPRVKDMVERLNRDPKGKEELFSENEEIEEEIEKLLRLDVLRERDGKIHVNFTLLDESDNEIVFDMCEGCASDMVEEFLSKKDTIFESLDAYGNEGVEKEKLAFMIIGCYILDWSSLELLRRWNVCDHKKRKPSGNEYIIWGESERKRSLNGVYWGGHALFGEEYTFHTFGDHHGYTKRKAFPDIAYGFQEFDFDGGDEYRSLLFEKRKELLEELGDMIDHIGKEGASKKELKEEFDDGTKRISLLRRLNYVEEEEEKVYLKIPYFTEEDIDMILDCMEPFVQTIKGWVEDNIEKLEVSLQEIRPIKNGVAFEEVFVQVWHVIFGLVNKKLAHEGLIFDTYSRESEHKGYLPGLVKGDVLDIVEEEITDLESIT